MYDPVGSHCKIHQFHEWLLDPIGSFDNIFGEGFGSHRIHDENHDSISMIPCVPIFDFLLQQDPTNMLCHYDIIDKI